MDGSLHRSDNARTSTTWQEQRPTRTNPQAQGLLQRLFHALVKLFDIQAPLFLNVVRVRLEELVCAQHQLGDLLQGFLETPLHLLAPLLLDISELFVPATKQNNAARMSWCLAVRHAVQLKEPNHSVFEQRK